MPQQQTTRPLAGLTIAALLAACAVLGTGDDSAQVAAIKPGLEGREFSLRPAPAASGERYVVEQGRRSDWSMEWYARGGEALLSEAPLSDDRRPQDLQVFLRCQLG